MRTARNGCPTVATYCAVWAVRLHYRRRTQFKAMEFAITAPAHVLELMTPGSRTAPGVFLFRIGGG
jgi:hypothetical protein